MLARSGLSAQQFRVVRPDEVVAGIEVAELFLCPQAGVAAGDKPQLRVDGAPVGHGQRGAVVAVKGDNRRDGIVPQGVGEFP